MPPLDAQEAPQQELHQPLSVKPTTPFSRGVNLTLDDIVLPDGFGHAPTELPVPNVSAAQGSQGVTSPPGARPDSGTESDSHEEPPPTAPTAKRRKGKRGKRVNTGSAEIDGCSICFQKDDPNRVQLCRDHRCCTKEICRLRAGAARFVEPLANGAYSVKLRPEDWSAIGTELQPGDCPLCVFVEKAKRAGTMGNARASRVVSQPAITAALRAGMPAEFSYRLTEARGCAGKRLATQRDD